jgi:hypothetical protein
MILTMLRRTPEWEQYELEQIRRGLTGYVNNIGVVNAMADHVDAQGKNPLRDDPRAGLDDAIRLAKALNARLRLR